MSSSSEPHIPRTAYEVFLADLRREPSAADYEQWATDHAGDPDEPRALVDAAWSIARSSGDLERALGLFRRAAGFGGEAGRDAQVGIVEQLYALHRDQEADQVQRALRAELDDQPSGLGTVRVFDDMTEMLSDAGQDHLALEWCQRRASRARAAWRVACKLASALSVHLYRRERRVSPGSSPVRRRHDRQIGLAGYRFEGVQDG